MRRLAPVLLCVQALGGTAWAGGPRIFRQTTAKDFEEGEAQGASVLPTGEIEAGLATSRLPLEVAFVWCGAVSHDGATAFLGTGDEGKIYAVDLKGGAAPRKLAEVDAAWVTALLVKPDGTLVAGTTPGGRIVSIDPKTGKLAELAKLPTDHVWSLAWSAKSGTLYAGSGPVGKIFAIDGRGKASPVWDSGDKHVVALAAEADGSLLAGTSEQAILYRVRPDGRAEALQDFEAEEVRAIVRGKDGLYVAVNDFEKASGGPPPAPPVAAAPKGTKIVLSQGGPPSSAGALPRPGQRKAKSAVYRLESDGRIEQLHALPDGYLTALLADATGAVYAASGTQGKVHRIASDRTVALAVDVPERQILTLLATDDGFLVGTGDTGGVYRARKARGADASYLSKVFDAEAQARWGVLRWHGGKGIGFETRSGNTAKPDSTWTDWRAPRDVGAGADGGQGAVASPAGRYLQYRVKLGDGGILRDVAIHYLTQNLRARVTDLTVNDAPAGAGVPAALPPGPSARVHSAIAKLRIKVENPDNDEIVYRLAFRGEAEAVWRPLGGPDPLTKPEYDWNTESVPDGLYAVRVIVSDERANPRERALESTFISPPFLVDNRKPEIAGLEVRWPFVAGRARDEGSTVTQLEFAIDGGDWQPVAPQDGILDQPVEAFSIRLPPLPTGPHVVTVRAWDAADNVGAQNVVVRVK